MDNHIVKILETDFITHNVKRFVVEKPAGYTFIPGQATDVSINKPGLETELRPFTFTAHPVDDYLEFMIKIYKGHDGITEKLAALNTGDELILHEVFGAITYKGPGVFIAGGAGITPFVAILRNLKLNNQLAGHILLFANHSDNDIILKYELETMLCENLINVIKEPMNPEIPGQHIDQTLLGRYTTDLTAHYYICGPDQFTLDMVTYLRSLGITDTQIILEQ